MKASNIFGEGHPFIILHGFLGMGDNWKTLGKKFSEQGFEVHLVDQRNHGRSFQDDEFNYEVLTQDLKQYCDAYQLDNIILLGNAFYDQRISEIESLIKQVDSIEDKNSTEIQFLQSLKQDLAELKRRQKKLLDTTIEDVGDGS